MTDAEVVPTEYTHGVIGGADYGSRARVLLRSPDAVIFVAQGVHMTKRQNANYTSTKHLCEKANAETLSDPNVRARIVEFFGEGADEAALLTTQKRGFGTVLFNGGGKRLGLPHKDFREQKLAEYAAITPTQELSPAEAKTCLQCSKPLRLHTIHHHFASPNSAEKPPTTLAELQRLTNYPIVGVHGFDSNKPREWWPYIDWFETWDGESYLDDTFCSDRCAAIYGRRAAAELAKLNPGGEPPRQVSHGHESIHHYDTKAEAERQMREIEESFARMRNKR
jgi:hypothetical protein